MILQDFGASVILGVVAVLVFDTLGSLAARRFRFAYPNLAPGSFAIYMVVGYAAGAAEPVSMGILAGAVVALIESTVGWAISWKIGPGRPSVTPSLTVILRTVAIVTALGAVFGGLGGWLRG